MNSGYSEAPRVLVLSAASLSRTGATGITLSNLFSGWPRDKLAQICGDEPLPDPSICASSYLFSSGRIPIVRVIKSLRVQVAGMRRRLAGRFDAGGGVSGGTAKSNVMSSFSDGVPFRLPRDLIEWAARFDPQVVYSPLGSIRMMSAALQLSKLFNIPIVPHFMDDWPGTLYVGQAPGFILRRILRNKLDKVLSRAPFGLTICDDMSREYARRYGIRFEAFMNCADVSEQSPEVARFASDKVVFGYVGGLHLNRWRSLRDVAASLEVLKDEGVDVQFDIFAPEADIRAYRNEFEGLPVLRSMGSLEYSDVRRKLLEYDVLVHVESFMPNDSRYTRLSISTKIPQYMAAGRPILAYGPDAISSIVYVARAGVGLAVTKHGDLHGLANNARRLIRQPALRVQLGEVGRLTALERHDAIRERKRLMALLAEAATRGRA